MGTGDAAPDGELPIERVHGRRRGGRTAVWLVLLVVPVAMLAYAVALLVRHL